jgi:hypothetical protein
MKMLQKQDFCFCLFLSNNLNLAPDAYGLLTSKVADNLLSY